MRLVTLSGGQVGRVEGDVVVELDVRSMRDLFEHDGRASETGERYRLA